MSEGNIETWVDAASNTKERALRQAIHIIIHAVGQSDFLKADTFFKGGILLGIRYDSHRYTKDLDASCKHIYSFEYESQLLDALRLELPTAAADLNYDLECRIQSSWLEPRRENASFQTLRIKVGYAYRSNAGAYRRLERGQAADTVTIDYSFNELVHDVDIIGLADGTTVSAYGLNTLIAEKFRAILQQPSRKRTRPQDAFDISHLVSAHDFDPSSRQRILESLLAKAESRGLSVSRMMIHEPQVYERSRLDYGTLADQLPNHELPDFDDIWNSVTQFYDSLPWPT